MLMDVNNSISIHSSRLSGIQLSSNELPIGNFIGNSHDLG